MTNHLIVECKLNELPWQNIQLLLNDCYRKPPRDVFQKVVSTSHQTQRAWLAMEGSNALGIVMLSPHSKGGHLENLAVDPSAQGKGIGRMLVRQLLKSVQNQGPTMVTLTTRIPEYFEPFGFKVCGKLRDDSSAMLTFLSGPIDTNRENHEH